MTIAARKKTLTDKALKALKPAPAGKRYVVWDAALPGFGVRVTETGATSFVVVHRRPGERNPDWHVIGKYPVIALAAAREEAPKVLRTLAEGKRPAEERDERRRQAANRRRDTVAAVAEEFLKRHVARLRSARAVEALIRRELLGQVPKRATEPGQPTAWANGRDARWRDRPLMDVTRRDAIELIEAIADGGSRHQARKTFAAGAKLFGWAITRDAYGIAGSPFDRIKFADVIGTTNSRDRVLSDAELRLIWRAAGRLGYPHGTLIRALMLSGQRLREWGDARWSEIEGDVLTIPAERMKNNQSHAVPLTPAVMSLLETVPRFEGGDFIYTVSGGKRPIGGFSSKARARLDREIAALRREDATPGETPPFVIHDIRRTVRTRLSGLGIMPLVAEMVIGHKQTGIAAVYDLHRYSHEKRAALTAWEQALLAIVEPKAPGAADNIVALGNARRA
ncbi:MAG TPA: integrase family protein [Stellaceae bacterium]|jgi:integrase|nr:integrase family protein [Stellaceae bacterium]